MKRFFWALAALALAAASPAGDLQILQPSIPTPPNAAMTASGYVVFREYGDGSGRASGRIYVPG